MVEKASPREWENKEDHQRVIVGLMELNGENFFSLITVAGFCLRGKAWSWRRLLGLSLMVHNLERRTNMSRSAAGVETLDVG